MFGLMRSPAQSYATMSLETQVNTASPHQLILLLFDGAIQAISLARIYLKDNKPQEKGTALSKAIALITEGLRASLDPEKGSDLAWQLDALYDYMARRLIWANLHNDDAAMEEVINLLNEIRGAWAEIGKTT